MINALDIKSKDLGDRKLFIIRGIDPYLRDHALSLFRPFIRNINANEITAASLPGNINIRPLDGKDGTILVRNAEALPLNDTLDVWFHNPPNKVVVFLVSVGKKMESRYARVVGRKGKNILCDVPFERQHDLCRWVTSYASRRRVRLSSGVASSLLENCNSLLDIVHEIEKFRAGWLGRAINETIADVSVVDKSGGLLNVCKSLFDGDSRCLEYAATSFSRGLDVDKFIEGLLRQIMIRLRMKETGLSAKRAALLLNVDMRKAVLYSKQASRAGLIRMWGMIESLIKIQNSGVCKQVYLLLWLKAELVKFQALPTYNY